MRYLTNYIDPTTGREKLGTGADAACFHEYANVENVIRFGLRKDIFPAGQYNIYRWPADSCRFVFVRTAYKQA